MLIVCLVFALLILIALVIIMAKLDDVLKQLTDLGTTVSKIGGETSKSLQMITDLQAQIANNTDVPQAVADKVNELAVQLKAVDDLVPDAPTP